MTRCRRTVFGMVHSFSFRGRCDRSVASGSSSGSSRLPRRSMSKTPHRTTFRRDAKFFLQDTFRPILRSEEHTSELQSLMRISYAVFCLKKNKQQTHASTSKPPPPTTTQYSPTHDSGKH